MYVIVDDESEISCMPDGCVVVRPGPLKLQGEWVLMPAASYTPVCAHVAHVCFFKFML